MNRPFQNRSQAGQLLARALEKYANRDDVIVLGLPRGGVPVAFEVAQRLSAPLDVFVVRKLGVPGHPELAMGAIATGGVRVLNEVVVYELDIPQSAIDAVARGEERELRRRELAYRGHGGCPVIARKTVIIVDDGIATGSTLLAAVRAVRHQSPARLIAAAPVAASMTAKDIRREVDELIVLEVPREFVAVGQWYEDFGQTTDEEVTALLDKARAQYRTAFAPLQPGAQPRTGTGETPRIEPLRIREQRFSNGSPMERFAPVPPIPTQRPPIHSSGTPQLSSQQEEPGKR